MEKNIYFCRKYHEKEKKKTKHFGLTSAPLIALTLPGSKREN